ncbi:MAG: PAS domain S-box protein [Archangium sp.]|nr:PAS domain S-box protein [Archangium sp.]
MPKRAPRPPTTVEWAAWAYSHRDGAVRLSAAALKRLGLPASRRPLTYQNLQQRIAPRDLARVTSEVQAALALRAPLFLQLTLDGLDGVRRHVAVWATFDFDAKGALLGAQGQLVDLEPVTGDCKRLPRLQRLYLVLLAVNRAMLTLGTSRELRKRTREVLVEIGGYAVAHITSMDADVPSPPVGTVAQLRALLGAPPTPWIANDLARDQAPEWLRATLETAGCRSAAMVPILDEGELKVVLTLGSVERQAFLADDLELLRQLADDVCFASKNSLSEQRFRAAFLDATDAMLLVEQGLRIRDANPAAAQLLGYAVDTLKTMSLPELTLDDRFRWQPGPTAQLGSLRARDGRFLPVEVTVRPINASLQHVVVRDVRPRHQLESQLLLADRLASLGTLAAGVAHELNNPLSWILSNLTQAGELLEQLPSPDALRELRELMTESLEGANRIVSVVSDLRTFSRPDSPTTRVSLVRVIERALSMLRLQTNYRGRVQKHLNHVPDVIATEAQLGQVFIHLLLNAVHALPPEGAGHREITVSCFTSETGDVVGEVKDTGSGISPEVLPRIFDPFFTTKPTGVGTGLGLSVIYNIVTNLQGRIEVTSVPGEGSAFRVVLPPAT